MFFSVTETPFFKRRCLILGHEDEVETMTSFLAKYPFVSVVHFPHTDGGVLFFEQAGELLSLIKPHEVDEIIVGETAELSPEIRADLIRCRERGIGITPFSVLYESLTERIPLDFLGKRGWPLILLDAAHARGIYPLLKRFFDVVWGLLGLVGFGILFPFIAPAIKLDSPGPILYRQVRRGQGGQPFAVWKLRTMFVDAEKEEEIWSNHRDQRVTRVGRLLRKIRLDEFPQCWNILKGEMSVVGPRPQRFSVAERLEHELPFYRLRNIVKPGMAGWAMVNRGYMCSFDDAKASLEYDLYYIKHRSLWLDAVVFLRSFGNLFMMTGR